MNEIYELWSPRWHELQHSLADSVTAQAAPIVAGMLLARDTQDAAAGSPSWLARARTRVQQVAGRGL